ncbi:hypothetical protein ACFB49_40520 [Sphingomonas sp. DBB INV C78]
MSIPIVAMVILPSLVERLLSGWIRGVSTPSGQQLIELADWMPGDASEHIGELGLWIQVIEAGRLCRATDYAAWAEISMHIAMLRSRRLGIVFGPWRDQGLARGLKIL